MKTKLTVAAMLIASASFAQCLPSTAMDTLNINQVSALILNGGDMHWDLANAGYEVPKGSGVHSVFASAVWIGGIDAGSQLHVAGQTYRQAGNDFWPGPLDTTSASTNISICSMYDKIWKVNRYKVQEFINEWTLGNVQSGTYVPGADILNWPGNGNTSLGLSKYLAPFVDVNGNGIYDPINDGDYPKIKGDQMLWTVFNDVGDIHSASGGMSFGIEIHASAYAYTCPQIADSLEAINYTTLYHYEIFNRSAFQYDSVYLGYWQDGDLGCYTDDYVGCNRLENYGYIYNADSNDLTCGSAGYGLNPPISSTILLNSPSGNQLEHFVYFTNGAAPPQQDPANAVEYYNYLSGKWQDGTIFTIGGTGYGGVTPTPVVFPDFPYNSSGWSEVTVPTVPGDRRSLMSSGPFTFLPGSKIDFDFAIVWSRDTSLPYLSQASFDKNLNDNLKIKQWFLQDSFPSCLTLPPGTAVQEVNQQANEITISPNPTSGTFQITSEELRITNVAIYNVLGEIVLDLLINQSTSQPINLSSQPNGVYFVQVKTEKEIITEKIVIQK